MGRPISCKPIGNLSLEKPHGMDIEGVPVKLLSEVKVFLGANVSSKKACLEPRPGWSIILGAGEADVGRAIRSTELNNLRNSSRTICLSCWAL